MKKKPKAHPKLKMARRMLTSEEIENNVSPFNSAAWDNRKYMIQLKEKAKRDAAIKRREQKKLLKTKTT